MEELKRINKVVAIKQIGRIIFGTGFLAVGSMLIMRYGYQAGFTDAQKSLAKKYPDIYKQITEKVLKEFE